MPSLRDSDDERRRRRALIRAHHPDRGGDPDEFVRLLQRFEEVGDGLAGSYPEVMFAPRRRRWKRSVRLLTTRRLGRRPKRAA